MDKEQAITILQMYRDCDKSINLIQRQLNDIDDQYYCSVGAVQFDAVSKGGGISSPTENYALNIPQSVYKERVRLESKIETYLKSKARIEAELDKLPFKQKNIVLLKDIRGLKWVQISAQCFYCVRQCKNIRSKALKKLCLLFSENPDINKMIS